MRQPTFLLAMLASGWITSFPVGASAQSGPKKAGSDAPAASGAAQADALIARGIELRKHGDDMGALQAFEQAHELSPTPRALAQRALAEQALGRWAAAEEHLLQALAAEDDAWIAANRAVLDTARTTIQEHLSSLSIHGGVDGAVVRINGQPVGSLPLNAPLRLPAGTVVLDVAHEGYYPIQRQVTLLANGRTVESITMAPRESRSESGPAAPAGAANPSSGTDTPVGAEQAGVGEPSGGLPPVVFWIGVGTTAVLGGVSLWSGLGTRSANDDYETYSLGPNAEFERSRSLYDEAKSRQDRTNVLLGATAVVAVGTGVIATLTDWGGGTSSASGELPRLPELALRERGAQISYTGRF